CCGDTKGKVTLRDPSTLKSEHVLDTHSGTLSDFDVSGNLVVTCGFSSRHGHLTVDRLLMVYDLRTLRALTPIQVSIEPVMLKFLPSFSSRLAVVSQSGQFQFTEPGGLVTASSMYVYNINAHGGMCTALDVSSNCHTMAFGDSSGYLHLWGDTKVADLCYNNFSIPTEFATEVPRTQHLSIDDYSVPLSSFPLPYSNEPLFSNWPSNNYIREDRNPIAIDPEILRTMVVRHFIGYAPNPGNKRRNQWPYQNKPGHYSAQNRKKDESDVPESPMSRDDDPSILIPKAYRRVEMKYSKLGLEDFDFGHYNKTKFAGLEIHIPNAYCNAMLQ
ncbi:PAN2-PAN3 deadenylation complex catalytic subunit PAN2, partial [Exaiptasia diaphana]|uniref:PAN2-PAN3 deadenylation complex catalytic subunit PAN2 N-terminal domain-containing protein n=1 Tax=Exaiptasia diaphana TaxID=2652724 RepID=A0A913WZ70_EXADI